MIMHANCMYSRYFLRFINKGNYEIAGVIEDYFCFYY